VGRGWSAVESFTYHTLRLWLGTATRAFFERIEMHHEERIPAHGPLIVAANHPAALTDVLVLGPALPRRVHFLAYSGMFWWPLGTLLRLAGAVPVYRQRDAADETHRNEETFRACNELLRGGGAIAIFPEGHSVTDRQLQPLRTGTARLAFSYEFGPLRNEPLTLLPIGLHFEDRARFRSRVAITVGRAIELEPFREVHERDPAEAVRELTQQLQAALEKLIVNIPSPDLAQLVRDVEKLYLPDLKEFQPEAPELVLGRSIAECVEYFRVHDRERLHQLWSAVNTYQRKLAALRLSDPAVREVGDGPPRGRRLILLAGLGFPPAAIGAIVNVVPFRLSNLSGSWFDFSDPTHVAFSRIIAGLFWFPLTYAGYAWLLWRTTGWSLLALALTLAAGVPLGLFAHGYARWFRRERERLRAAVLANTRGPIMARMRSERRRLMQLLDKARDDYLSWVANTREGPEQA
jgi:glycerol-3-phosphate O-acyltransferase / dihydroxyacetone phosphate acyltransferase